MLVYKDYFSFIIDNQEVDVYASDTAYGFSVVLNLGESYYYLGDQFPDLDTVILAWQDYYNINFSEDEILRIKQDNIVCKY